MNKTRQNNIQKRANRHNFAKQDCNFFTKSSIRKPIAKSLYATRIQSQEYNCAQQIPKSVSIEI